ncbi:MAG: LLM class flavin-dependent oxidoreductase [Candidatus Dormibacteraeota bacterium]|nr:LLM class flavin-dependent oxidoreductase [Candidatus Dormibacteraeota bacterium]
MTTGEPRFRLGLSVPVGPLQGLPELAREAEARGWTDVWSQEARALDAFTPLASVGAVTRRLRLGSAIAIAALRAPGMTAMQTAALASLAPGRVVLGLGASTRVVVEQWHGVPFPAKPLTDLRERTLTIRRLLDGERVGGLRLEEPPSEPVPIYLAALGPRMLELSRTVGAGVVLFLVGPRRLAQVLQPFGDAVDSVERLFCFPGRFHEVAPEARRAVFPYTMVPYYARSIRAQGFGEEMDAVAAAWAAGERAASAGRISDALLKELVVTGSPDDIAERVEEHRKAGLRTPVLAFPDAETARTHLESLAPST